MEYLKYFENKTSAEGYKTESDFVAWLGEDRKVLYSKGGEVIKDGEMVEVYDPAPGFVDLGLSVMWAECNLGASSPEETGLFYSWGEVEGHRLSADGVTFEDRHVFSESTSVYQSESKDLTSINDAVSVFYKDQYYPLEYRMPTASQIQELLDNTTHSREIYNGIEGWRFTSSINGNSIFIPSISSFTLYPYYKYLWTRSSSANSGSNVEYACAYGEYTAELNPQFDIRSYGDSDLNGLYKWSGHQIRGVCNYPPTVPYLSLDEKTTCVSNKENIFAIAANQDMQLVFDQAVSGQIDLSQNSDFTDYKSYSIPTQGIFYLSNDDLETNAQYMYMRITTTESTNVTLKQWANPYPTYLTCAINEGSNGFGSSSRCYRIAYSDIKGKSLQINNAANATIYLNIVTNPGITGGSKETETRLYASGAISRTKSVTIPADKIVSWEENIEEHGFVYLKRYSTTSSNQYFEIDII